MKDFGDGVHSWFLISTKMTVGTWEGVVLYTYTIWRRRWDEEDMHADEWWVRKHYTVLISTANYSTVGSDKIKEHGGGNECLHLYSNHSFSMFALLIRIWTAVDIYLIITYFKQMGYKVFQMRGSSSYPPRLTPLGYPISWGVFYFWRKTRFHFCQTITEITD